MKWLLIFTLVFGSFTVTAAEGEKKKKDTKAKKIEEKKAVPAPVVEKEDPKGPAASASAATSWESYLSGKRDMQFTLGLEKQSDRTYAGFTIEGASRLGMDVDLVFLGERNWGVGPVFNLSFGDGTSWGLGIVGEYDFPATDNIVTGPITFKKMIPFVKAKMSVGKYTYDAGTTDYSTTHYVMPYLAGGIKLLANENFYIHGTAFYNRESFSYENVSMDQTSFGAKTGFGVQF